MRAPRRYGTVTATSNGGGHRVNPVKPGTRIGVPAGNSGAFMESSQQAASIGSIRAGGERHGIGGDAEREPLLEANRVIVGGVGDGSGPRTRTKYGWGLGGGGGRAGGAFASRSSRRDNGKILTTILVLNYMIGSGILNSAEVFEKSGIAWATILYFVAAVAVWFGMVMLVKTAEEAFPTIGDTSNGARESEQLQDLDFAGLARETMGRRGPVMVNASIVVGNFGDVCSYVLLVGSLTGSLLQEWFGGGEDVDDYNGDDSWWSSFSVVTPIMVAIFVLPPCLVRHFSNLRWLSAFCLFVITLVILLVVFGSPVYASYYRSKPNHDPGLDAAITYWDGTGAVGKFGSIVFALSCSPAVLHAYTAMFPRSERVWGYVALNAIVLGGTMCFTTGLMGYLSFRDATESDILDNFSGTFASLFKAFVVIHLILYIPSEVVVLRHSLFAVWGREVMEEAFAPVFWVTFWVLSIIVGIMVGLEAAGVAEGDLFGYILDLTGGFAGSITSFILPAMAYLGATKEEEFTTRGYGRGPSRYSYYRTACKALVCFGMFVMVMVPSGVALDILGY